ncbi:MAG: hypothetical protein DWQ01_16145 [Planctomycetota bacterium]|nr:MAG: hypothetical protein DWQ01_16145 [Planctomycetota bacterium]
MAAWVLHAALALAAACPGQSAPVQASHRVSVQENVETGSLRFAIDGREAFVYQFDTRFALPHLWPLRSPTGRPLTVQKTEPFPHHRSIWFADKVQLKDGPVTDFYHEWANLRDKENPKAGHHSFIRHEKFTDLRCGEKKARATAVLTWMVQEQIPVLAQSLHMELEDLGAGEYLLQLSWEWKAEFGPVKFHSDWVHYAWPFLRMDPKFSGEQGGTIEDDQGRRGQKATNQKYARWIDYSNTVDGVTEGLTVFVPDDGQKRKWLTREYGTFGPRRPDAFSGSRFTLQKGESLRGRVVLLVHQGNASSPQVRKQAARWCPTQPQ